MTVALAVVPPPVPVEELKGVELEDASRAEMRRALGLTVTVSAPTWREIVFMTAPILLKIPEVPPGVAGRLGALRLEWFAENKVGMAALALAEKLQKAKPGGTFKRSAAPGKPLPVAHGAFSSWERLVFLVACGPDVAPLLAAASYLTGSDVDAIVESYPEGVERQRLEAVTAAATLTRAAARTGHDPSLSEWANGQILTLMAEEKPADVFQAIYASKANAKPGQQGSPADARSKIAENYRPTPGTGDATR